VSNGRTSTSIVYGALDLEQRIDTADDVDRDRGERDLLFAGGLAARILDISTKLVLRLLTGSIFPSWALSDNEIAGVQAYGSDVFQ
jgi:hypothetical protein